MGESSGSPSLNRKGEICPACNMAEAVDGHHIYPLNYGGRANGKIVYLCPTCHDELHRLERQLYKGEITSEQIREKRSALLTRLAVEANRQHLVQDALRGDGVEIDDEARRTLMVSLTKREKAMFVAIQQQFGISSQEKTIKAMIKWFFENWVNR